MKIEFRLPKLGDVVRMLTDVPVRHIHFNPYKKVDTKQYVITEGVEGTWHYHLSEKGEEYTALCGKRTMKSHLPMASWGTVTHLKEKYCKTCVDKLKEIQK